MKMFPLKFSCFFNSVPDAIFLNLNCLNKCECLVCFLQHVGAVLGFLQQPSLHDKAEHLLIGQPLVRLFSQSGHLPQDDSEWPGTKSQLTTNSSVCKRAEIVIKNKQNILLPDIRVCGEHSIFQGLRGHPAHREQTFAAFTIVVCLVDVPGHAKVYSEKWILTLF